MFIDRFVDLTDPEKSDSAVEFYIREKGRWAVEFSDTQIVKVLLISTQYYYKRDEFEEALRLIDLFKESIPKCEDNKLSSKLTLLQAKCFCKVGKENDGLLSCANYVYYACAEEPTEDFYTLYSFRGATEYAILDIEKQTMSFQHPSEFNDPLDTMLFRWVEKHISEEPEEHWYQLKKAINHMRVRCFVYPPEPTNLSESRMLPIERIHPLMWGHYADRHHGFCVVYKVPKSFFSEGMVAPSFRLIHEESYDSSIPDLSSDIVINSALFTKSSIWSYENEVRILDFDMTTDRDVKVVELKDTGVSIEEVYFGVNCSDSTKKKIVTALRSRSTKLYQMEINEDNIRTLKARRIG